MRPASARDLVVAHGRGFWILDDVTPLRRAAEAAAASSAVVQTPRQAFLFIRFGTDDPTPWPRNCRPEENPPNGAIVDYYLPSSAGEVKLEFHQTPQKVLRTCSSTDKVMSPGLPRTRSPTTKICQQTPTEPDCGLPLYWPAPQQVLASVRAAIVSLGTCTTIRSLARAAADVEVVAERMARCRIVLIPASTRLGSRLGLTPRGSPQTARA